MLAFLSLPAHAFLAGDALADGLALGSGLFPAQQDTGQANPPLVRRYISLGGQTLDVEIADTNPARVLGLSNRESLPAGTGMLFVYDGEGQRSLWMKDMNFPLDMLWFSAERELVHIERDVSPETYPEQFVSPVPAQYVLELPAGYASQLEIEIETSKFRWR